MLSNGWPPPLLRPYFIIRYYVLGTHSILECFLLTQPPFIPLTYISPLHPNFIIKYYVLGTHFHSNIFCLTRPSFQPTLWRLLTPLPALTLLLGIRYQVNINKIIYFSLINPVFNSFETVFPPLSSCPCLIIKYSNIPPLLGIRWIILSQSLPTPWPLPCTPLCTYPYVDFSAP